MGQPIYWGAPELKSVFKTLSKESKKAIKLERKQAIKAAKKLPRNEWSWYAPYKQCFYDIWIGQHRVRIPIC